MLYYVVGGDRWLVGGEITTHRLLLRRLHAMYGEVRYVNSVNQDYQMG
jgi:hypothetical protein